MAVVNVKSTIITNRDAIPLVLTSDYISGGALKEAQGYAQATNGDSATSKYRLTTMPSNARLASLIFQCQALGAAAKLDIGAYYPTSQAGVAGAVISANFFAAVLDVAAAVAPVDILNSAGNATLDLQEKRLWELLGLASDPGGNIDLVATVNVAIAATGKLSLKARFVQ